MEERKRSRAEPWVPSTEERSARETEKEPQRGRGEPGEPGVLEVREERDSEGRAWSHLKPHLAVNTGRDRRAQRCHQEAPARSNAGQAMEQMTRFHPQINGTGQRARGWKKTRRLRGTTSVWPLITS